MKRRERIKYTAEQQAEIWDRWKRGETMHDIGRAFDRFHSTFSGMIRATGGIRPPVRARSRLALTLTDIKNARRLPSELYKSLTWDRGVEMTDHAKFTVATI